jgi:hypothetical protein
MRTVVAPDLFASSNARTLKVLVPQWENTTTPTLSSEETTYLDLTKSKLCMDMRIVTSCNNTIAIAAYFHIQMQVLI